MSNPFLAEIRICAFNFAPRGWAFCNGQIISISQNTALFSLLGTFYGGNGTSNFALPNLQGSAPVAQGSGPGLSPYEIGETGGSSTVTATTAQLPSHAHVAQCDASAAAQISPTGNVWAKAGTRRATVNAYSTTTTPGATMASLASAGGGQPHNNLSPYLCMSFIIALQGIFPARN